MNKLLIKNDFWIVRINRETPKKDYKRLKEDINENNIGSWDADNYNKMKINDFIGFITGSPESAILEIYMIYKVNTPAERNKEWKKNEPYMPDNGIKGVRHRNKVKLTNIHNLPKEYSWLEFKKAVNYSPDLNTWMPRGTMPVKKNKDLIPF